MLYDLERDPNEQRNLVADPAFDEVTRELRRSLASRLGELRYGPGMFPGLA